MALLREHAGEALAGLAVVAVAVVFLLFALARTQAAGGASYALTARFPNATGVSVGTDVRVAGIKVGRVSEQRLDPKSYQAVVTIAVDKAVQLPVDSSAAITSEGLLGGSFIALMPGGEADMLADGEEIADTQGATDLLGLVGAFINRGGGSDAPPAEPSP